jgi:hypothetical protein
MFCGLKVVELSFIGIRARVYPHARKQKRQLFVGKKLVEKAATDGPLAPIVAAN